MLSITLQLPDDLARNALIHAAARGISIEEHMLSLLSSNGVTESEQRFWSEREIDVLAHALLSYASKLNEGMQFLVTDLYEKVHPKTWANIAATSRQALGRRFRAVAEVAAANAEVATGGRFPIIRFHGKTPQNQAIYVLEVRVA